MERASTAPIIVCPLAFERDSLRKAGVSARILCIGPGERGVQRLLSLVDEDEPAPVILAGLAGGIDGSCVAGSAVVISEVIGDAACWQPPWRGNGEHPEAKVATSREVLTAEQAKRDFSMRTGAHLVDQESTHFAHLATAVGWNWGIVRGVSDDLSTTLPPDIHNWVTEDGRTRILCAVLSCLMRPKRIGSLMALQRNSTRAMTSVAEILNSIV